MRLLVICIHSGAGYPVCSLGRSTAEQRTDAQFKTLTLQISFLITALKLSLSPSRQKEAARSVLARRRRLRLSREFHENKKDFLFLMEKSGFRAARSDVP